MSEANFYSADPWLKPFTGVIDDRISKCKLKEKHLTGNGSLADFAVGHLLALDPFVDRVAIDAQMGGDFFDGQPALLHKGFSGFSASE